MLASKERPEDLQTLQELLEAGKVTPVIDRTFPLHDVPEAAFRQLVKDSGHGGKIVITVERGLTTFISPRTTRSATELMLNPSLVSGTGC
jgi:Zinc-binding dehydrogenase